MQGFQAAAAGFISTLPMTIIMHAGHKRLPPQEQYPLPPREIVNELLWKTGVEEIAPERFKFMSTLVAHFAYGALAGSAFAAVERHLPGPVIARGASFGLMVWGASYFGLLPTLGILKPAHEAPLRRNLLMIAAHLVWGAALATLSATEIKAAPQRPRS